MDKGKVNRMRRELKWLVEAGPRQGLLLSVSSSVTPLTNRESLRALIDGLSYDRCHGRDDQAGQPWLIRS